MIELKRVYNQSSPDIVHLHSTRAHILGQLVIPPEKILFSPHCFGFQRLDIPRFFQKLLYALEKLFARRGGTLIAHWPVEKSLGEQLGYDRNHLIFYPSALTNLNQFNNHDSPYSQICKKSIHTIVSIGRICNQKDPFMFSQISSHFQKNDNWNFVWIGDGDAVMLQKLQQSGVIVTGWIENVAIESLIQNSCATIISSRWESGPLTLFEALRSGSPVLCRPIQAFEEYSYPKFESPIEFINYLESHEDPKHSLFLQNQFKAINQTFKVLRPKRRIYD